MVDAHFQKFRFNFHSNKDVLLSLNCWNRCLGEVNSALCATKCLGEERLSMEIYHLASWIWECSSECLNDPMGTLCFAICFQTRSGHVAEETSTEIMMQCTKQCSDLGVTCVVQCIFPEPEVWVSILNDSRKNELHKKYDFWLYDTPLQYTLGPQSRDSRSLIGRKLRQPALQSLNYSAGLSRF